MVEDIFKNPPEKYLGLVEDDNLESVNGLNNILFPMKNY